MTQQWGPPGQGQQWPAPPGWNSPGQAWGAPPSGQPGYGRGPAVSPYGPQYGPPSQGIPQAQFGRPSYGPPGGYPPPRRPQRRNPLHSLLLGLVLVVGIGLFAITLMDYLSPEPQVAGPNGTRTTAPGPSPTQPAQPTEPPQPTVAVPAPDTDPPEIPQPETYGEAEAWLIANPVYDQTAPVPTECAVPLIDIRTAPVGELSAHLNDLTACLWRVWSDPLEQAGYKMPRPPVTVYTEPITSGCGQLDEVNAVYCAADQRIYYAKPLWKIFPSDQQGMPFVVESVIAHEFGHAIQARTGILISSMAFEQQASSADAKVFSAAAGGAGRLPGRHLHLSRGAFVRAVPGGPDEPPGRFLQPG